MLSRQRVTLFINGPVNLFIIMAYTKVKFGAQPLSQFDICITMVTEYVMKYGLRLMWFWYCRLLMIITPVLVVVISRMQSLSITWIDAVYNVI